MSEVTSTRDVGLDLVKAESMVWNLVFIGTFGKAHSHRVQPPVRATHAPRVHDLVMRCCEKSTPFQQRRTLQYQVHLLEDEVAAASSLWLIHRAFSRSFTAPALVLQSIALAPAAVAAPAPVVGCISPAFADITEPVRVVVVALSVQFLSRQK